MARNGFNAPNAASVGSYSHAVEIDGFLYLSGQTPLDPPSSALVVGSIAEQTRQCFANLIAVLETAGLTTDNVIKCNTYLTDMNARSFIAVGGPYRAELWCAHCGPVASLATDPLGRPDARHRDHEQARHDLTCPAASDSETSRCRPE